MTKSFLAHLYVFHLGFRFDFRFVFRSLRTLWGRRRRRKRFRKNINAPKIGRLMRCDLVTLCQLVNTMAQHFRLLLVCVQHGKAQWHRWRQISKISRRIGQQQDREGRTDETQQWGMRLSSGNVYILFHLRCVDNLRTIHKNVLTRADYIYLRSTHN